MIKKVVLLLCLTVIALSIKTSSFAFSTPPPAEEVTGAVDSLFENYVAIGDSTSQGMQCLTVDEGRQHYSFPAQLARQMNTPFIQALIKFPGFFMNFEDVMKGNIAWYQYFNVLVGGVRTDNYRNQDRLNNFGVSGATVAQILSRADVEDTNLGQTLVGWVNPFFRLALGAFGEPAVTQALNRNPSFVTVWIGNNDALITIMLMNTMLLSSKESFRTHFTELISRINAQQSIEGVMLSNIPDLTGLPMLEDASGPGIPEGSKRAVWQAYVWDETDVITKDELDTISKRISEFNEVIEELALANDFALVDAHDYFEGLMNHGAYLVKGGDSNNPDVTNRHVTMNYAYGGIVSLDGGHPTNVGYALCTNQAIKAINKRYGTDLKLVNEVEVAENCSLYTDPVDPRGPLFNSWAGKAFTAILNTLLVL